MREDANSPVQIVPLTPAALRAADGPSVAQRDFSFFCWMLHFTLLLARCCISSMLVITKIAR